MPVDRDLTDAIRNEVAAGVVQGLKALADDEDFKQAFWKSGFDELSSHAGNASSQWIGRRILTALIVAITTAGIVWLVKSGGLK